MKLFASIFAVVVAFATVACDKGGIAPTDCSNWPVLAKNSAVLIAGRSSELIGSAVSLRGLDPTPSDSGDVTIQWRSTNSNVVAINGNVASAIAVGSTRIIASACGDADTVDVDVVANGYSATFVGPVGPVHPLVRHSLNDSGAVAAQAPAGSTPQNYLWRNGTVSDLGSCQPLGITNNFEVLCRSTGPGPTTWRDGATAARDTLTGVPAAINSSGMVAYVGTLWRGPADVAFFRGWEARTVTDVNAKGDVVGLGGHPGMLYPGAALWQSPDLMSRSLDGFGRSSGANAVNDSSDVAGSSEWFPPDGSPNIALIWRANALWDAEQFRTRNYANIALLNDVATSAVDINNGRQVVGSGSQGAFVWQAGKLALIRDLLADPTWTITSVHAINNRGEVLAIGSRGAQSGAVLLSPP